MVTELVRSERPHEPELGLLVDAGDVRAGLRVSTDYGASAYSAKPAMNWRLSPYTASPTRSQVTPSPT